MLTYEIYLTKLAYGRPPPPPWDVPTVVTAPAADPVVNVPAVLPLV